MLSSVILLLISLFFAILLPYNTLKNHQIFEFYSDKITIRKPFFKKSLVQKSTGHLEIYHNEWDEVFHFSKKHGSILYFRKDKTLTFIIEYAPIYNIAKKLYKSYPRKKIYLNAEIPFPFDLIENFKVKFPEKYFS